MEILSELFKRIKSLVPLKSNKIIDPQSSSEKHSNSHTLALNKALTECQKEIRRCKRWNSLPSPKCFEHAAMLSRQSKNYRNEIKICQTYIALLEKHVSNVKFNKENIELKADNLSKSLAKRLEDAKKLQDPSGVDVQYL